VTRTAPAPHPTQYCAEHPTAGNNNNNNNNRMGQRRAAAAVVAAVVAAAVTGLQTVAATPRDAATTTTSAGTYAVVPRAATPPAALRGGAAPPVNVTLYSESLCPDCIHFITGVWWSVYSTPDVAAIITWNQVVFGNAQIVSNTSITCQHGATECKDNIAQSCAQHVSGGNVSAWLPFIHCMETHGSNQAAFAKTCAAAAGIDITALDACWNGAEGLALQMAAGAATAALQPPHQFVPWVTLNDTPGTFCSDSDCDNFLAAVCAAYTGTPPASCKALAAAAAAAESDAAAA